MCWREAVRSRASPRWDGHAADRIVQILGARYQALCRLKSGDSAMSPRLTVLACMDTNLVSGPQSQLLSLPQRSRHCVNVRLGLLYRGRPRSPFIDEARRLELDVTLIPTVRPRTSLR